MKKALFSLILLFSIPYHLNAMEGSLLLAGYGLILDDTEPAKKPSKDQSAECLATMSGRLKTLQSFLCGCEASKEITEQLTLLKEYSGFPKDDPLPKKFLDDHKHELLASAQVGVELARMEVKAWIKNLVKGDYSTRSYLRNDNDPTIKIHTSGLAMRYENALVNQMLLTTFLDQNKP